MPDEMAQHRQAAVCIVEVSQVGRHQSNPTQYSQMRHVAGRARLACATCLDVDILHGRRCCHQLAARAKHRRRVWPQAVARLDCVNGGLDASSVDRLQLTEPAADAAMRVIKRRSGLD